MRCVNIPDSDELSNKWDFRNNRLSVEAGNSSTPLTR